MRRGHGSTKVPGVKLRPAAPRPKHQTKPLDDPVYDENDDSKILSDCAKPFKGLILCASGVSDKVTLFQHAIQLGAKSSSDLTDRVTHLICEAPGSQKYNFCIAHGIPVMKTSWVHDLHAKWLDGEALNMEESIKYHRFPTFQTVRLCVTAIDDLDRRTRIQKLVEANGGTYVDSIGKGVQLTHLICGPDRGDKSDERGYTAKMKFVEKLNKTSAEKVHLVWEEWFWDCMDFHGLLSTMNYSVNQPRPKRRSTRDASPLLEPIASTADQVKKSTANATSIQAASDTVEVEEVVALKQIPEATARLWEGLLRTRGYTVQNGKLTRDPSKAITSPKRQHSLRSTDSMTAKSSSSLKSAFSRTKSMAMKSEPSDVTIPALQHLRTGINSSVMQEGNGGQSTRTVLDLPDGERDLFSGLKFKALGDADGPKLVEAIELRGGSVMSEVDANVDFVIVRLASGGELFRSCQDENHRRKFRTECWVEQCIFEERLCLVDEHLAFAPLNFTSDMAGAGSLKLHISGLLPHEKTPTTRLIKAIGAPLTDQFSRRNTHLLCPSASGPKFVKAQEWGIPVVTLEWLYDTVKRGEIQDPSAYIAGPSSEQAISSESAMADITNCEFIQGCSRDKAALKKRDTIVSTSTENSSKDELMTGSWITNGLLSEDADATTVSPRKMSALSLSSHPATPTKEGVVDRKLTQPTQAKIVPSSTTPSPLKIPTRADTMIATPSTLTGETQANSLNDALTSLLGKRSSSDDSESRPSAKVNKRSKAPPRSRSKRDTFSRTTSTDNIPFQASMASYPLPELNSNLLSLQDEEEDSMRVTYEDPSQQKEKEKLLSIINEEAVDSEEAKEEAPERRKTRNLVRRATRK